MPVWPPVGTPIGARADGPANARWFLIVLRPYPQIGDAHEWVSVLRFIERQGDGTGHLSGYGEKRTGRHRRRVEEFFL